MVVKKHPKDEIPDSLYSYLDMCQKAEDIPGNNHVFDKGDFFSSALIIDYLVSCFLKFGI
jgi:hypothetical protein